MIAYLDYIPAFCPNCGADLKLTDWQRYDFTAGVILRCTRCGAEMVREIDDPDELRLKLAALQRERDALARWKSAKLNGEPLF